MRQIGVVTSGRADYGILRPVLRAIEADPRLELRLYATGTHLVPAYGSTVGEIEADGFEIAERVEILAASDSPRGTATSMALATLGFSESFARERPDLLVLLGDRFEIHAVAVAALPFNLPIGHIHGGESSEGAMDEGLRHSLTKLSHLHFPATEAYGRRIVRMGEEPWRVTVSGAPSLDNLSSVAPIERAALDAALGLDAGMPILLVTYHPVTLDPDGETRRLGEFLAALEEREEQLVISHPNADTARETVLGRIREFADGGPDRLLVESLGTERYFGLMAHAEAMVGNSSSGIIEAASFELPVVNVGARQRGRLHGENVIDVGDDRAEIAAAIERAVSPEFRRSIRGIENPYGDGRAAQRIADRLATVELGDELIAKRFHDDPER